MPTFVCLRDNYWQGRYFYEGKKYSFGARPNHHFAAPEEMEVSAEPTSDEAEQPEPGTDTEPDQPGRKAKK
jgi:hypothetical protein